jgi:transposase
VAARNGWGGSQRWATNICAELLVVGMTSLVRRAKYKPNAVDPRLADLLSRKPVRVVTVALANKTARVIWVIMTRGGTYRAPVSAGTALIAASAA